MAIDPQCLIRPDLCAGEALADALAGSAFGQLRDLVLEGVGQAASSVGTMWISVPTIGVTAGRGGAPSEAVAFIQSSLWVVTLALLTVSLIIGGARLTIERRGEPFMDVLKGIFTFVVISGGGLFVLGLLLAIVDELSNWIIDRSVAGTDFGENIVTLLQMSASTGTGSMAMLITIIAGIIAIVVAVVQIAFMVLRAAIIPVLAGVWPTAAAFSGTPAGKRWFEKITSWIVAFVFYKLAAAIVYATAFRLMGAEVFEGDDAGMIQVIAGVLLMVVAVVALPALVRLFAPMVGAVTSGAGGGGGAAVGGLAMVASGAVHAGGRSGASSASAPAATGAAGAAPSGARGVSGARRGVDNDAPGSSRGRHAGQPGAGMIPAPSVPGGPQPTQPAATGGSAAAARTTAASGGGAAAGAGATSAGAAAAAGPAAPAALGAQAAVSAAQAIQTQVRSAAESATDDSGPSGAR